MAGSPLSTRPSFASAVGARGARALVLVLVACCLGLALGAPGFIQRAWADSGDGTNAGVVEVIQDGSQEEESQGAEGTSQEGSDAEGSAAAGSAASGSGSTAVGLLKPQVQTAGQAQTAGQNQAGSSSQSGSQNQGQDNAESDKPSPKPLDGPGNVVNEGQLSDSSFLDDAAIADLAGADSYYDCQTVQVTGEVVGEAISDGKTMSDHVWILLQDRGGDSVVNVWIDESLTEDIDHFGKYGTTGSILRVRGEFHLCCPEHQGECDIHATTMTVVQEGYDHPDEFDPQDFIPGLVCVGLGVACYFLFRVVRERVR